MVDKSREGVKNLRVVCRGNSIYCGILKGIFFFLSVVRELFYYSR